MKLTHKQALQILECKAGMSFDEIKKAYRASCSKYHPDRNPAGLEMMQLINAAWNALSDYDASEVIEESEEINLNEELYAALNATRGLGLTIEVCGTWVWVSGDTKPHKEVLKAAGYEWAPKKMMWYYRPAGSKSWSRGKYDMNEIRGMHGSVSVKSRDYKRLSA